MREHAHDYVIRDPAIARNERKTLLVAAITSAMMVVEVIAGYLTSSMALLADGWHMASHAGALTISVLAYRLAKSDRLNRQFSFGAGKLIPLGGYTSAILLAMIALLMAVRSVERLLHPVAIQFNEAIAVAILGLAVNVFCALILDEGSHSHPEEHEEGNRAHRPHSHDHNLRSAYINVLADALTSICALAALLLGKLARAVWLDPAMGIVGAAVILRWAYMLCKETARELLDGHARPADRDEIRQFLEREGAVVLDLHVWRIAPSALACEILIESRTPKGSAYYRKKIGRRFPFEHLIIEECRPGELRPLQNGFRRSD